MRSAKRFPPMIIYRFRLDQRAIRRIPIRHWYFAPFEPEPAQRPFDCAPNVEPEHFANQVECIALLSGAEVRPHTSFRAGQMHAETVARLASTEPQRHSAPSRS